jgi:phenylalanyl-tRNA synthetase alpha chain
MIDLDALGTQALGKIAAATDLDALEALRVEFLGKQGSISGLLKTLGAMSPEERQTQGVAIQALRGSVTDALAERKAAGGRRAGARWPPRRSTCPARARGAAGSVHPVSQVMDELAEIFADWALPCQRAGDRGRLAQFHRAQHAREPSGARDARHLLSARSTSEGRDMLLRTHTSPVQIRAMLAAGGALCASSRRAASIAAIATPRTRRCSTRSKVW